MKSRNAGRQAVVLGLTLLFVASARLAALAAQGAVAGAWSAPVERLQHHNRLGVSAIVADARGSVHLFWAENLET